MNINIKIEEQLTIKQVAQVRQLSLSCATCFINC